MSVYEKRAQAYGDAAGLCAALNELGFAGKWELHAEPVTLHDWHGAPRPEQAHLVIRRAQIGGASNDVGFLRGEHGQWTAIVSEYDRRQSGFTLEWEAQLQTLSSVHNAMLAAKLTGLDVTRTVNPITGRPKLVLLDLR